MAQSAHRGAVGISGTSLFLCVAGHQSSLQTNCDWHCLGNSAAADDDGRFHHLFWPAGEAAVEWTTLSGVLFRGFGALGLLRTGAEFLHEYRGGESAGDYEGLFSEANFALGGGVLRAFGFCDWICRDDHFDFGVRDSPARYGNVTALFSAACGAYGAGRRLVGLGSECFVSRRSFGGPVFGAILDAGIAGWVPQFACAT